MTTETKIIADVLPIIPVDDGTRDMLAYAESPAGSAKIEQARKEISDGKGIPVTPNYFADLNQRIANRVLAKNSKA